MYFDANKTFKSSNFIKKTVHTKILQMQTQITKQEKSAENMATYFNHSTVNFNSYIGIKQPHITNKDKFYKVYSPEKFKLRPRDDIYLDLKFDIQTPETIEPWLNLLPSLKSLGLHIENEDWVSNKTKNNTIQLHILNRSFNYTASIKKNQCVGFIFLLGEQATDTINTKYNLV